MANILCVEDETLLRKDIAEELRDHGHDVVEAADGAQALDLIRTEDFDLVVSDIRMPIMDGYQLLEHVREGHGNWANVPFLFLTAFGEREDMLKGLASGADDYITKPVDYDMLLARISSMLRHVNRASEQVRTDQRKMQKELNRAHKMQRDLLPSDELKRVLERAYNIRLTSHYEPSTELGGDIWGVQLISASKVMFYLIDFAGHGIAAAMNTFRIHSHIDTEPLTTEAPNEYLERLNDWLKGHMQTGQYATVTLGIVDFERQVFEYASAGSTSPVRIMAQEKDVQIGFSKGVPLGLVRGTKYELRTLDFNPGDALFLYSDALLEHGRKEDRQLGRDGLEKMIRRYVETEEPMVTSGILEPFLTNASRPLSDDLTAFCCFWKPAS
jgi:sigma-B regulation protein RsbU (phosphoserine phosphatase)